MSSIKFIWNDSKNKKNQLKHQISFEEAKSVFWDENGLLLIDFADSGVPINSDYYSHLVQQVRKARRKSRVHDLYYLADNAPIHTSHQSTAILEKCGLTVLPHPPYSPDLAPSDYYLFRHLKQHLRGQRFTNKQELKDVTTNFLRGQPQNFYKNGIHEFALRWRKCADVGGSYFEK